MTAFKEILRLVLQFDVVDGKRRADGCKQSEKVRALKKTRVGRKHPILVTRLGIAPKLLTMSKLTYLQYRL